MQGDQLTRGRLGERGPLRVGPYLVRVAVDHKRRATHASAGVAEALGSAGQPDPPGGVGERLGIGLERPADAVLDLLARVRLGEALGEEELKEAQVVPLPVVAVVLGPVAVAREWLVEGMHLPLRMAGGEADRGTDVDDAVDALGVFGGEDRAPQRTAGERDQHRPVGGGRVHDGERVVGELVRGVRRWAGGTVGAAVAAAVERHHPEVAGQVGDLRLPEPGVDDRPRRQQEDGRLA